MPLPALIPFDGDWPSYEELIYSCFCETLVEKAPFFRGKRVSCRYHPPSKGKHDSFWHCISEGEVEEERTIDPRRAERIAWIAWMINNADACDEIICIKQKRGRNDRVVLLHTKENYAVVLNDARNWCGLITSFCPRPRKVQRLIEEFKAQNE